MVNWSFNHLVIWSLSSHLVIWSTGHLVIWSSGQYGYLVIWSYGQYVILSSGHLVVSNIVKDCTTLLKHLNNLRALCIMLWGLNRAQRLPCLCVPRSSCFKMVSVPDSLVETGMVSLGCKVQNMVIIWHRLDWLSFSSNMVIFYHRLDWSVVFFLLQIEHNEINLWPGFTCNPASIST